MLHRSYNFGTVFLFEYCKLKQCVSLVSMKVLCSEYLGIRFSEIILIFSLTEFFLFGRLGVRSLEKILSIVCAQHEKIVTKWVTPKVATVCLK